MTKAKKNKSKKPLLPPDSIPAKMLADIKGLFKKKRNAKLDWKKIIASNAPLLIFAWLGNKMS